MSADAPKVMAQHEEGVLWPDDAQVGQASAFTDKTLETAHDREQPKPKAKPRPRTRRPVNPDRLKNAVSGRAPEAVKAAIPPETLKGLTRRQQVFVEEYLLDLNATQAAIRAGYSPKSARQVGHMNMKNHDIMAAIDTAFMELGGITRSRIVEELAAIAFADIREVVTWEEVSHDVAPGDVYVIDGKERVAKDGGVTCVVRQRVNLQAPTQMEPRVARAIAEVSQTDKGSVKIKLHDKLAALDKLARALGMYQPIEDATSNPQNLVAANVYVCRPASTPPHGEPASEVAGDD
jgi:phage terminase small subunit